MDDLTQSFDQKLSESEAESLELLKSLGLGMSMHPMHVRP